MSQLYVGRNLLTSDRLAPFCQEKKPIVIADEATPYGQKLSLELSAPLISIAAGEGAKSFSTQQALIDALCRLGCAGDTLLIAVGGGSVTDLVGFVASIYMRGLPHLFFPTTLVGMVDAAIGGKTAINTAQAKNLLGTLYFPKAIFADLDTLQTLPEKEWLNGFAEILKMGLIYDKVLWEMAQVNYKDPAVILRAMQNKIDIVEQDMADQSIRRILNFGHTIGHPMEVVSEYTMSHGEAVFLGSLVEAHLSMELGRLSSEEFAQIEEVYRSLCPALPNGYCRSKLMQAMMYDKKRAKGISRFVLLDQIGMAAPFEGAYVRAVTESELTPSLHWMENYACSFTTRSSVCH